jgi:hypothetical protein
MGRVIHIRSRERPKTNKSTAYIAVLFVLSIVFAELHQLFAGSFKAVDTWFVIPLPGWKLTLPWYIHDIGQCMMKICWALIGVVLSRNTGFRVRGIVFTWLGYCITDLILYLVCYQRYGYGVVEILTGGALVVILLLKSNK